LESLGTAGTPSSTSPGRPVLAEMLARLRHLQNTLTDLQQHVQQDIQAVEQVLEGEQ
jgi:hypothetical protein